MCVLFDEDFREKSAKNRDYRRSQAHSNFHCDCDNLTSPSYDASLFTSVFIVTSTPPAAAGIQEFFLRRSSLPAFRHILSVKSSSPSADRPVKVCRLFVPVPCLAALCLCLIFGTSYQQQCSGIQDKQATKARASTKTPISPGIIPIQKSANSSSHHWPKLQRQPHRNQNP